MAKITMTYEIAMAAAKDAANANMRKSGREFAIDGLDENGKWERQIQADDLDFAKEWAAQYCTNVQLAKGL